MADPQVKVMADMIRARLPGTADLDQAVKLVRMSIQTLMGTLSSTHEQLFAEAVEVIRRECEDEIEILHHHSLLKPRSTPWYRGPRPADMHWPALSGYLTNAKSWKPETLEVINESSTEVVSLLEDPAKDDFACTGLVVGYVQSGKTANMTAVIAKAVDAGYNFVVVLAGLTNALRLQTQRRLETDIVDRHRFNWNLLTHHENNGDFRMPANRAFQMPQKGHSDIAVLKKNKSPLEHFIRTLSRTQKPVLSRLRVLVLDDECDQASVNASSDEYKLTVINERIRNILSMLPCVSYVGYTATPFANVLINPYPPESDQLDDLYPKDFITALPKPVGYFGTEDLFGREPRDAGEESPDEEGLDMICTIPDEDEVKLQPPTRKSKDSFYPKMALSLEEAILYFLACCAARLARGHEGKHMSMLVHTSAYVIMHERVAELICEWLDSIRANLSAGSNTITARMEEIWERELKRLPDGLSTEPTISFNELRPHLAAVLNALEVPVENGFSDDRIDYNSKPRTYIVVGGSVLARGLTIEGLIVSYFLRSSSQYDTLLQMGRWFGYRLGYEDLPRIWMTSDLSLAFRALATVEAEIRSDIDEYKQRNVTPMEFAVRIRSIPGMAVTAANKMRAARVSDVSYAGKHVQTIRFAHKNSDVVRGNWNAGAMLLDKLRKLRLGKSDNGRRYFVDVPLTAIISFLRDYSVHETHKDLSDQFLLEYIVGQQGLLQKWTVGLWEPRKANAPTATLGGMESVALNNRAQLKDTSGDVADIKALMSRKDMLIDCPGLDVKSDDWTSLKRERANYLGDVPLLLLYPIDANSSPQRGKARTELDAVGHLLGFGIVFPGSTNASGTFVSVQLEPLSADEIEDADIDP